MEIERFRKIIAIYLIQDFIINEKISNVTVNICKISKN